MSLARAFTTRKKPAEIQISSPMYIGRAASQRAGKPVPRSQISSPMALISTSNALLNNAQQIGGTSPIEIRNFSSGSSFTSSSADDSDASSGHHSSGTITDASSVDESPISAEPEPNHLSCYFKPAVDTQTKSPSQSPSSSARPSLDTPRLPQRVPSHSKKAHETLHRKRSIQRVLSPPPSRAGEMDRSLARSSTEIFSPTKSSFVEAPKENPFGSELAQLDEVAEEFGHVVRDAEAEADISSMKSRGLAYFSPSDYLFEIESLIHAAFNEPEQDFAGWI